MTNFANQAMALVAAALITVSTLSAVTAVPPAQSFAHAASFDLA